MKIEAMTWTSTLAAAAFVLGGIGCGPSAPAGGSGPGPAKSGDAHAHAHPSHGPHGGELVELGDEEYHAEVVHSEKSAEVTIYLLDSHATKAVAVDAKELLLNVTHSGKPEQLKFAAAPQPEDPAGKSSKFTSVDPDAIKELHEGTSTLKVVVEGKPYSGKLTHKHDHDHDKDHKDHDHKHDEKAPAAK